MLEKLFFGYTSGYGSCPVRCENNMPGYNMSSFFIIIDSLFIKQDLKRGMEDYEMWRFFLNFCGDIFVCLVNAR
jgi:hypothetical protein